MFERSIVQESWRVLVATIMLVSMAAPAAAQHVNHTKGFDPEQVYQLGAIDHVNLFNGALTVTLPIGQSYPVGGSLSYGLTLSYTGNPWDFEIEYDDNDGDGIPDGCEDGQLNECFVAAWPLRTSNAGLGWHLTLGQLRTDENRLIYVDPTGSRHPFFDRLSLDQTTTPGIHYTRDGTYLRLRDNGGSRELDFPDGTIHVFDDQGRVTEMRDRFADASGNPVNRVTVDYQGCGATDTLCRWTLTDSAASPAARSHEIRFRRGAHFGWIVDEVELATADGAMERPYKMIYTTSTISRACDSAPDQIVPPRVRVPLLTGIRLPDDSTFAMAYETGPAGAAACDSLSGNLTNLTLPTGGTYDYTYQLYQFPQDSARWRPPGNPDSVFFLPPIKSAAGVATRTVGGADIPTPGTWTYATSPGATLPDAELVNTVTDPLGHYTEHYFSVWAEPTTFPPPPPPGTWSHHEYGLPITRAEDTDDGNRLLSTRTFERDSSGNFSLLRETFLTYELEHGPGGPAKRVTGERTRWAAGRFKDRAFSDYDGVGHYRTSLSTSDYAFSPTRTVTTAYPDQGPTMAPLPNEPWVLETFDSVTVHEAGDTARTEFCFDGSTGFLERQRNLAGADPGPNDVLVRFAHHIGSTPTGNIVDERHYGGDGANLPTGDLCAVPLAGPPAYRLAHTYSHGVRASSEYLDASGNGLGWKTLDLTIDPGTGLPTARRDAAGFATAIAYDDLGRVTRATPSEGAWTQYNYVTNPASVTVSQLSTANALLGQRRFTFDGLGRLRRSGHRRADGAWSEFAVAYHPNGVKKLQTVVDTAPVDLGAAGTARTSYLDIDALGRPRLIDPAHGPNIGLFHAGDFFTVRDAWVGTTWNGQTVTQSEIETGQDFDAYGRLVQVREQKSTTRCDNDPVADCVFTRYVYDASDQLEAVSMPRGVGTQTRTFDRDHRGFLRTEGHPEKFGLVRYSGYDALGNVGVVEDTVGAGRDLRHTYDRAGRIVEVKEVATNRVLKRYVYGDGTTPRSRGKLVEAERHNYVFLGGSAFDMIVRYRYAHDGVGGRVSSVTTEVELNGNIETFVQTYEYDDLGQVTNLTYPNCDLCPGDQPPSVDFEYANGFLTKIPGWTETNPTPGHDIAYHPNGLLATAEHANGTVDVVENDPRGLNRPRNMSTRLGPTTLWSSGAFRYDGAGNITGLGVERFTYDSFQRLASAWVLDGQNGNGSAYGRTYTYDPFGNLVDIAGSLAVAAPTDWSSNRLLGGTYDNAGNLIEWGDAQYEHDALGRVTRVIVDGPEPRELLHAYDINDERFLTYEVGGNEVTRYSLRDLDAKVLREIVWDRDDPLPSGTRTVRRSYIYRGTSLFAAVGEQGPIHFHGDHLGSTRMLTAAQGNVLSYHDYLPFGREVTPLTSGERIKFGGHEWDHHDTFDPDDDLSYLHARYYNANVGRFLSVDPARESALLEAPQSWNRFAYVLNNPLKLVDPDGEKATIFIVSGDTNNVRSLAGHAAILVERDGRSASLSVMGAYHLENGTASFVNAYTASGTRRVDAYELSTTREQDLAMIDFIEANPEGGTDKEGISELSRILANNCTRAVANCLKAGGVVGDHVAPGRVGAIYAPSELSNDLNFPLLGRLQHLVTKKTTYTKQNPVSIGSVMNLLWLLHKRASSDQSSADQRRKE